MRIHHATAAKAKKFKITLTVEDNEVIATDKNGVRLASGLQGNKVLEEAITKATGKPAKGVKPAAPKTAAPKAEKKPRKARIVVEDDEEGDEEETGDESEALADAGDDESDADQSKSIVKAKYRARYKPNKDKCGDELSFQISEWIMVEDDETGDNKVSKKLLRDFAEANGCWVPAYGSMVSRTGGWNAGTARMNVVNRLRAKIRQAAKDEQEFKIVWPKG